MDSKTIGTMMSSKSTLYGTPKVFFDKLDNIFHFDLDVCAIKDNSMLDNFISPNDNSFRVEWNGRCWMNPPYGRDISRWIDRAINQSNRDGTIVVCLLPARTDTKWFQKVFDFSEIIMFVKGRLKFGGIDSSAPFPSLICVLGNISVEQNIDYSIQLSEIGNVVSKSQGMFAYR